MARVYLARIRTTRSVVHHILSREAMPRPRSFTPTAPPCAAPRPGAAPAVSGDACFAPAERRTRAFYWFLHRLIHARVQSKCQRGAEHFRILKVFLG